MVAPSFKAAPGALDAGACDWLINWMDRRAAADVDAFRQGDFLNHYWPNGDQREIMAGLFDEVFRLRRIVVDLESDFAAMRAGRALYKRGVTVADIIQAAAVAGGALASSIRSLDNSFRVVAARQIAVFVAKSTYQFSIDQLGAQLWRYEPAEIQRMFDLAEVRRSGFADQIELTMNALRGVHG